MITAIVVCSSINPETGNKLLVQPARLPLLDTIYYDKVHPDSEFVEATKGWLTVVGGKAYRVYKHENAESEEDIFATTVEWDDLEVKPIEVDGLR